MKFYVLDLNDVFFSAILFSSFLNFLSHFLPAQFSSLNTPPEHF